MEAVLLKIIDSFSSNLEVILHLIPLERPYFAMISTERIITGLMDKSVNGPACFPAIMYLLKYALT